MKGLLALSRRLGRGLRSLARDAEARGLVTLALAVIAGGAVFYRRVEDMSWIDSLYFTIVTLTTVGYGDLSPQTTIGKVFTMAYLLIGVGIMVAFVGEVAGHVIRAGEVPEGDGASDPSTGGQTE